MKKIKKIALGAFISIFAIFGVSYASTIIKDFNVTVTPGSIISEDWYNAVNKMLTSTNKENGKLCSYSGGTIICYKSLPSGGGNGGGFFKSNGNGGAIEYNSGSVNIGNISLYKDSNNINKIINYSYNPFNIYSKGDLNLESISTKDVNIKGGDVNLDGSNINIGGKNVNINGTLKVNGKEIGGLTKSGPNIMSSIGCSSCPLGSEVFLTYDSGNKMAKRCKSILTGGSSVQGYTDRAVCEIRGDAWDNKKLNPGMDKIDVGSNQVINTFWTSYDGTATANYYKSFSGSSQKNSIPNYNILPTPYILNVTCGLDYIKKIRVISNVETTDIKSDIVLPFGKMRYFRNDTNPSNSSNGLYVGHYIEGIKNNRINKGKYGEIINKNDTTDGNIDIDAIKKDSLSSIDLACYDIDRKGGECSISATVECGR